MPPTARRSPTLPGLAHATLSTKRGCRTLAAFAVQHFVADQRETLRRYRVEFDRWFHESRGAGRGRPRGSGAAPDEAGHTYEADGAVWMRTTEFGDDKDRVLVKSDGEFTYVVPRHGLSRGQVRARLRLAHQLARAATTSATTCRLKAPLAALGYDPDALEIIYLQMVHLVRGGEEVRMSKRRGEFVTMADFLDEVERRRGPLVFSDAVHRRGAGFRPRSGQSCRRATIRCTTYNTPTRASAAFSAKRRKRRRRWRRSGGGRPQLLAARGASGN